ncbi:NAD(P)-binding domain-containing protein, partial [uncultured Duncaniella sp.]
MIPQTTGHPLSIVFIGAGNVATHLAQAFEKSDVGNVVQVFSRSIDSAKELAHKLHAAEFVNDPSEIVHDADVYVVSLVDHAVDNVIKEIPRNNALWL